MKETLCDHSFLPLHSLICLDVLLALALPVGSPQVYHHHHDCKARSVPPMPLLPLLFPKTTTLHVLLDGGLKGDGVGADDLANLLAVLEEHEGGHGADGELLRHLGNLVDVELVEAGVGVLVGEPVEKSIVSMMAWSSASFGG